MRHSTAGSRPAGMVGIHQTSCHNAHIHGRRASIHSSSLRAESQAAGGPPSHPLTLYDISSPLQPPRSYAPNPSKTRYALNIKRLPFTTTWVDILDIPQTRKALGCPAVRQLDDGSDFYTLPMLRDPASERVIGDSFEIASYLEDAFPTSGSCLFPPDLDQAHTARLDYQSPFKDLPFLVPLSTLPQGFAHEAYARFNFHVDATFTAHVGLVGSFLPFNPDTTEAARALFVKRAHVRCWDDLCVCGEARQQLLASFEAGLGSLAGLYAADTSGPYLQGGVVSYADCIVGGWLNMFGDTMPPEEWQALRGWHGGVFARLHDALQQNYFDCS